MFKREGRYTVFKLTDVNEYLTIEDADELIRLEQTINYNRQLANKPPLNCAIVEEDWPEYEPTWEAIEARVTGGHSTPSYGDDSEEETHS
jgi:hypothetical protein